MTIFYFIIVVVYAFGLIKLLTSWAKYPTPKGNTFEKVSVIVAARNEEHTLPHLLQSIDNQTLDKNLFEVIVVNDGSTDGTKQVVELFKSRSKFDISLIHLEPISHNLSPKKRAISAGIEMAKNQIIFTTDADCILPKNLLSLISRTFSNAHIQLLAGPVRFIHRDNFFEIFQTIEFVSLLGVSASSIAQRTPNMCSGANLAYQKSAFEAVNGFEGINNLASGDDELLMQKIQVTYPNGVHYLKNTDACVTTPAEKTWKSFENQRLRWASKWKFYANKWITALAVFVFVVNVSPLILSLFIGIDSWLIFSIVIKFAIEIVFIGSFLRFLGQKQMIPHIIWVFGCYPIYVLYFGLRAQFSGFTWKNRDLK